MSSLIVKTSISSSYSFRFFLFHYKSPLTTEYPGLTFLRNLEFRFIFRLFYRTDHFTCLVFMSLFSLFLFLKCWLVGGVRGVGVWGVLGAWSAPRWAWSALRWAWSAPRQVTFADVPPRVLDGGVAVDVGQQAQTEAVLVVGRVGESVHQDTAGRSVERLSNTAVQLIVGDRAPVLRLLVAHRPQV